LKFQKNITIANNFNKIYEFNISLINNVHIPFIVTILSKRSIKSTQFIKITVFKNILQNTDPKLFRLKIIMCNFSKFTVHFVYENKDACYTTKKNTFCKKTSSYKVQFKTHIITNKSWESGASCSTRVPTCFCSCPPPLRRGGLSPPVWTFPPDSAFLCRPN